MSRIVTLTFSPCIDKSTSVQALVPEKKMKCMAPKVEPGGGGINVARAIKQLGGEAIAIFPSGGFTGKRFNRLLEDEGIPAVIIEAVEETRENIIVFDESSNQQYRFGMPSTSLTNMEWTNCLQALTGIDGIEYIVVSGSLPEGAPDHIFSTLAKIAKEKSARLIVDTSGDPLKEAAKQGVYLLKPNLGELASLTGSEIKNVSDAKKAASELVARGSCEIVIVSLGKDGALLTTAQESFHVLPPEVVVKSTVGAGDSMVAGIVYSMIQNLNLKQTLQYGVAAGTAATLHAGTELCQKDDTERLYTMICNI